MTFDQSVAYAGTPENLEREAGWSLGRRRVDPSGLLREWHERVGLTDAQRAAIRWLAAQPDGPAKILVISEEWSSDCRRDVPMLARPAEAGGMELRIFSRDGKKAGRGPKADPADSPNADIVNEFLFERDGQTYQSIPVAVFYTKECRRRDPLGALRADRGRPARVAGRPRQSPPAIFMGVSVRRVSEARR